MVHASRLSIFFSESVSLEYAIRSFTDFIPLRFSNYASTSTEESVYIIGGFMSDSSIGNHTPIIAKYTNDEWFNIGSINKPRDGHTAITYGSLTMIIGGWGSGQ